MRENIIMGQTLKPYNENSPAFLEGVISPYEEMLSYEMLWATKGMSQKN